MPTSNSNLAYEDCYRVLDQAVDAVMDGKDGIRAGPYEAEGDARHFQVRLNTARRLMRDENKKVFTPDDPQHGTSPYDPFVFRIMIDTTGCHWVYIQKMRGPPSIEVLE